MTQSYPLSWPDGFRRTANRKSSQFKTSVGQAVRNVQDELRRFAKDSGIAIDMTKVIISSNVTLTDTRPADPGVAAYFRWDNIDCCIAVDRYYKPEKNLQAISKVIEAERTKLRHGGLNIVRAGFRGFAALPPPAPGAPHLTSQPWWKVLGFAEKPSLADAETKFKTLVKKHHPDTAGAEGNTAMFNQLTDAIAKARAGAPS